MKFAYQPEARFTNEAGLSCLPCSLHTFSNLCIHFSTVQKYSVLFGFFPLFFRSCPWISADPTTPHALPGLSSTPCGRRVRVPSGSNTHDFRCSRPQAAEASTPLPSLFPHLFSGGAAPRREAVGSQAACAAGLAPPHGARSSPLWPAGRVGAGEPDSPASRHLAASFTMAPAWSRWWQWARTAAPATATALGRGLGNRVAPATERPLAPSHWLRALLIKATHGYYWFSCCSSPTSRAVNKSRRLVAPSGGIGGPKGNFARQRRTSLRAALLLGRTQGASTTALK